MIFAFLYGLSMDYEVFMLSRMREIYDETGDTATAISLGLARTGKLVTSAALVLMFAFFVLSSSPGVDIKQFGIGLAAGIIFDATVIRTLLVPSLMRLFGEWNWWMPPIAAKALFVREPRASGAAGARLGLTAARLGRQARLAQAMYFVSAGATGEEDELTPGPVRGYRLTAPSTSACAGFARRSTRGPRSARSSRPVTASTAWSRSRSSRSHRQRHLPLPNAKTTAKLGWR